MITIDGSLKIFGTEGSGHQKKAWLNKQGQNYLIKINSKYREALKEQDASIILRACGVDAVEYKAIKVNLYGSERNACICKSFLRDKEFTITLSKILEDTDIGMNESARSYMNKAIKAVNSELGIQDEIIYNYFMYILTADYLLMNTDRHLSNIEFIYSEAGWKLAPLFDFGQSFLNKDGIKSVKQFKLEERAFKTLPFSRNPEKNLVDINYAKQIAVYMLEKLGGLQRVDSLGINSYHGFVFKQRINRLLSL